MSYTDAGQTETDDFADYRDVSGIKVAYKRTSATSGRNTALTVDKVELDNAGRAGSVQEAGSPVAIGRGWRSGR